MSMNERDRDVLKRVLDALGIQGDAREAASDEVRDAVLRALVELELRRARVAASEAWNGTGELRRFDHIVDAGQGLRERMERLLEVGPELREAVDELERHTAELQKILEEDEAIRRARLAYEVLHADHRQVAILAQRLREGSTAARYTRDTLRSVTTGAAYAPARPGAAEGKGIPGYDPTLGPVTRRKPTDPSTPPARRGRSGQAEKGQSTLFGANDTSNAPRGGALD